MKNKLINPPPSRSTRAQHGLQNDHHYVAAMDAGAIFGFSRKNLSGY
jgi:hypothetical protein